VLRRRMPRLTEEEAGQLADALDRVPLAITQAAAYLAVTGMTVTRYLELLDVRAAELLTRGVPGTYPMSLAASWALAFDQLATDHPAALELLGVAAHLAPEPVPLSLFTTHPDLLSPLLAVAVVDPLVFSDLLGMLRRRALARVETDSLQLHRLTASFLRRHPITNPDGPASATVALRLLHGTVPTDPRKDLATWPAWRQLLPHVLALTQEDHPRLPADTTVAWLLDRAAEYLDGRGEPRPALPLATRAHHLYRTLNGTDHPDTLASAHGRAIRLSALGEYTQAGALAEDTLTRRRRVLGEDHPDTLRSAHSVAVDLGALGEYERARALNEETLTRYRRVLGEDHPDTLRSAHNLATNLSELGEHERARRLEEWIR
jgi:hypothetical protein